MDMTRKSLSDYRKQSDRRLYVKPISQYRLKCDDRDCISFPFFGLQPDVNGISVYQRHHIPYGSLFTRPISAAKELRMRNMVFSEDDTLNPYYTLKVINTIPLKFHHVCELIPISLCNTGYLGNRALSYYKREAP